jgi:hypothetical protein
MGIVHDLMNIVIAAIISDMQAMLYCTIKDSIHLICRAIESHNCVGQHACSQ